MSLQKTRRRSVDQCRAGEQQTNGQAKQIAWTRQHNDKENGRDRFSLSRPSYKPNVYGRVSFQALRPCVAAYRTREPGTIVSPATSTIGSPLPATCQSDDPFANLKTPQSFET